MIVGLETVGANWASRAAMASSTEVGVSSSSIFSLGLQAV